MSASVMGDHDARAPARPAAFAGGWYPRDRESLAAAVDACLGSDRGQTGVRPGSDPRLTPLALVSPHAGLMYSGAIAGRGYAALRQGLAEIRPGEDDRPIVAVLVGPSHYVAFEGVAAYPDGAFETPLGRHPIDAATTGHLTRMCAAVHVDRAVHAREHSLELQLPFLTRVLPDVPIVPLLMGRQTRATIEALATALPAAVADRRPILIASSDLSHYHDRRTASELDAVVLDRIRRFDAEGLQRALDRFPHHACGGGPIVSVMRAARLLGATAAHVVDYADSGDVSGDVDQVVGYLSAVLGTATGGGVTAESGR